MGKIVKIDSSTVFWDFLPYWVSSPGSVDLMNHIPDAIEFEVTEVSVILLTKLPTDAGRRYAEEWADSKGWNEYFN